MRLLAALVARRCSCRASRSRRSRPRPPRRQRPSRPPLILISIDGFRADYLKRGLTPTLQALADDGVRASAMHPSFPSLTFPNHYTLVTGLRPDHHGIVNNTMEDDRIQPDARFTLGTYDGGQRPALVERGDADLGHGETGGPAHRAPLFWPGSEAAIQGVRPDQWTHFDADDHAATSAWTSCSTGWRCRRTSGPSS